MLTDALLAELQCRGEGSDLDYKAERYPFAKASDDEKSEILKDILALANAHRDSTGYILIGLKENPPHPAEVIGLPSEGAIDDSRLQEFVHAKLESNLEFRYEEGLFKGQRIAVISIPKQPRPFYLKRDYGKLDKDAVYIRRGSATAIASPREIAMMGAANVARGAARVLLSLQTTENDPFPNNFQREFLVFPEKLPDFAEVSNEMFGVPRLFSNKNYWRDGSYYHSIWRRVIHVRLLTSNKSEFSLGDLHLEVTCHCPEGASVSVLRADDMPERPSTSYSGVRLERTGRLMVVDQRGSAPVAQITVGTIRPGQTVRAEEDLALLPSGPGSFLLQARILANEIPNPILIEHQFDVSGPVTKVSARDFFALMDACSDDDEE
ncbi:ATP-binding protein [Mesorhizobium sp.]|uniref:AlbA family DNA-binding domain-containing protein n=1 Tax=Mesorhizobium sp. TaxID=1871066 RepID=UPI000FE600B7|nr:ATP-binding protein [Mesorhizobium sp.]RWD69249.1 MAG: ATP-binding protein [Mesorhizobium sp.]TIV58731.1 MAG: ATP-binding protein [Mesorhizobium sp.]